MAPSIRRTVGTATLLAIGLAAGHAVAGEVPATVGHGLLAGLAQPIVDPHHLAFVLAVGLTSARYGRGPLLPIGLVAGAVLGAVARLGGSGLAELETGIATSVLLLGVLLAFQFVLPALGLALLFAVTGLLHGYAYGGAIVGSATSPVIAYCVGFSALQYAAALAALFAFRWALANPKLAAHPVERGAGAVVTVLGLVFLVYSAAR